MAGYAPALEILIEKFRSLPGIGAKTAVRLAFFILNSEKEYVEAFSEAMISAKTNMKTCMVCQNISETEICSICADEKRDQGLICVVENARDIITFEKVKEYNGAYHVLHGAISPMDGIGPEQIRIKELLDRVTNGANPVHELIIATDSNIEGEATAMYIAKLMRPFGVITSRIAYGIPVGGELEYADEITLYKALEGRREI